MNLEKLLIRKANNHFDEASIYIAEALFSTGDEMLIAVDESIDELAECLKNLRAAKKELTKNQPKHIDTSTGIRLNTGGLS